MGMFDKAAPVAAPVKPAAKGKTKLAVEVEGVEALAMIKALMNALETLQETYEAGVKSVATERFNAFIQATGQRPDSFNATQGGATSTMTMGRKSSTTALSDAAVELLRAHDLEPEKLVVIPELFAINPAYASDKDLLGKVEKAIAKLVPPDFIQLQPEVSKLVATEETLTAAIAKKAPAEVIGVLTNVSAKPKLKTTNLERILEFVRDELLGDEKAFGAAAEEAKGAKGRKLKLVA